MKLKDLELKIEAMEKEIAELKARQPIVINYPSVPCYQQYYPTYPYYPSINYPNTLVTGFQNHALLNQYQLGAGITS